MEQITITAKIQISVSDTDKALLEKPCLHIVILVIMFLTCVQNPRLKTIFFE